MKILLLTLFSLTFASAVQAEDEGEKPGAVEFVERLVEGNESLLTNSNFEWVWAYPSIEEDCPVDESDANKIVKAELLRARLKDFTTAMKQRIDSKESLDDVGTPEGFFNLGLSCLKDDFSGLWIYDVELRYYSNKTAGFAEFPTILLGGYLGRGNKDAILGAMKSTVEDGITEYLKANLE